MLGETTYTNVPQFLVVEMRRTAWGRCRSAAEHLCSPQTTHHNLLLQCPVWSWGEKIYK